MAYLIWSQLAISLVGCFLATRFRLCNVSMAIKELFVCTLVVWEGDTPAQATLSDAQLAFTAMLGQCERLRLRDSKHSVLSRLIYRMRAQTKGGVVPSRK